MVQTQVYSMLNGPCTVFTQVIIPLFIQIFFKLKNTDSKIFRESLKCENFNGITGRYKSIKECKEIL